MRNISKYTRYSAVRKLIQHKSVGQTRIQFLNENGEISTINGCFMAVACCLGPNTSKDIHLAPKAVIGDGILHVFAMRKKSRVKTIVSFLRAMQGTHLDDREVNVDDGRQRMVVIKTKNCTITTEKIGRDVSNLCVDGEISQIPASHTLVIGVSEKFVPFYS